MEDGGAEPVPAPAPPLPPPRGRFRRALPWAVILLATCATLGAGFLLKEQCVDHKWKQPESWFCYSDMGVLYADRGFDDDRIPYFHEFNEYPPVVAALQFAAAWMTETHEGWIHANEAMLAVLGLGTSLCLVVLARPSWRPLLWALGPPLVLYAFHNWDLAATFLTALGLLLFARGRPGWAGAALALGFHAKIYPALFLPMLGMELLRREGGLGKQGWRFGLASVGTLVGVAAPFLLFAREKFLETFTFHAQRGPTVESAWNALRHFAVELHLDPVARFIASPSLAILSNALILAFLVLFATAVRRGRLHWLHACLGMLVAFLVSNQVMSIQYALWVLPLLVLVRVPAWTVGLFVLADAACYYTVFDYFGHDDFSHFERLAYASLARLAAYLALLGWTLWRLRRPRLDPADPAPAAAA